MNQNAKKSSETNAALLSNGKSTRLLDMRRKAMGVAALAGDQQVNELESIKYLDATVKEEILYARQVINQYLSDILRKYPTNKQTRFFKIRFGMSVEELKELPIKEMCSVLGIKQKKLGNMARIAELNYFGRSMLD